ncbi:FACT complex subunit SSRP1-like isoform X2 [Stylophora pistillata]|uniref:Non-histone protein 10 n=1 Tax=Stylophora pistillata TaxID=50429 RepID=A0A2B4SYM8_STYPI|nr:FACT complex subunit SSRP1-like isoform X2 [Stylophora pistillata]PFX34279.1 Non-histone protein 10 [Stylophora pistillata]
MLGYVNTSCSFSICYVFSFLKDRLDDYNDDYRAAQPPFRAELLSEIVSEAFPKSTPSSFLPGEFISPDSPPVKKNKKRDNSKDKDKDKDPNAPKKPANAFFMYCQQQRTVMQDDQKDPNIGHHELTKSLAKEWNNLDTEDKKVYYEMYEKDKERYEKEMKKYTSDKVPKEPHVKKARTKTPKQKAVAPSTVKTTGVIINKSSPDQRSSVVSPALNNPLSPQSLASMQLNIPHIPMPQLLSLTGEDGGFDNYQEMHSSPQDSFL